MNIAILLRVDKPIKGEVELFAFWLSAVWRSSTACSDATSFTPHVALASKPVV